MCPLPKLATQEDDIIDCTALEEFLQIQIKHFGNQFVTIYITNNQHPTLILICQLLFQKTYGVLCKRCQVRHKIIANQ